MNKLRRIKVGDFPIDREEKAAINKVLDSGRVSEGETVKEFEGQWAKFIGTRYCIATSSGAGALMVSLAALKHARKLKNGMKVITTPITYIADSSAIVHLGFQPVYVDIDPDTFCITPSAIESHLKAIPDRENYAVLLPVDLMGYTVDIERISQIAKHYGLSVIEDAAQAHGSLLNGKMAGAQADLSIYSFYIAHNIQAGEMGGIVTNSHELSKLARRIKAQGRSCDCPVCTRATKGCPRMSSEEDMDPRFTHDIIGFNFKTMEFQAALALVQLKRIKQIIERRQRNVKYLNEHLKKYSEILQLPVYDENISYLAYPLVIRNPKLVSRKLLRSRLEKDGVETRPLFGCIPTQQPAFSYLKSEYTGKLPNAENIGKNGFYIGCHQYLEQEDLGHIVGSFDKILKSV